MRFQQSRFVFVAALVVLTAVPGVTQRGRGGPTEPPPKSEEFLLFGNSYRGAGEPMIAVDPVDSRHVLAVAMGNVHLIDGKHTVGNEVHHGVANSTINWLGISHDGGATW